MKYKIFDKYTILCIVTAVVIGLGLSYISGALTPEEASTLKPGDTVHVTMIWNGIKYMDTDGKVDKYDPSTGMVSLSSMIINGVPATSMLYYTWVTEIKSRAPESQDIKVLKDRIDQLTVERNQLQVKINIQDTYIKEMESNMRSISSISNKYR